MFCENYDTKYNNSIGERCQIQSDNKDIMISPTKKRKNILMGIFCILILCAFFVLLYPSPHSSPEAVLKAYVDAINDRDAEKLYNIAADVLHYAHTKEVYVKLLYDMVEEMGEDTKIKIDTVQIEYLKEDDESGCEAKARGVAIFKLANGTEKIENFDFYFSKIDGKWYWED